MEKKDKKQFSTILTGLAELYGKDMSSGIMELWFQALKAYDIEAISIAASAHVGNPDTGQYFPKPADIIRMISGTSKDSAYIAWSKVEAAVMRVGNYQSVAFDDQIIHAVVQGMGGWVCFGEKTEDEWPFVKNEFINRYQGFKSRAEKTSYPPRLIGQIEADNASRGHHDDIPKPILIGDKAKVKTVMLGGSSKPMVEFHGMAKAIGDGLKQIGNGQEDAA